MQLVRDIYAAKRAAGQPVISFEFFPPKTDEGDRILLEKTLPALLQTKPDYCSVTYGAGGSTREKTLMIVDRIQRQHGLTAVAHLTCVCATREQIRELLGQIRVGETAGRIGVLGIPRTRRVGEDDEAVDGDALGDRLVARRGDVAPGIVGAVAGDVDGPAPPLEGRPLELRDRKIDAGADFVITQLFFDNADFYEFREQMTRRHGVNVPLVPGIIPILSASQIKRFTALCGARIPASVAAKLEALGDKDAEVTEFGIDFATRQCQDLLRAGAPGIHFYTLNKAQPTIRILQNLGLP